MRRRARIVLEGVAPFVVAGLLFGILYNTLFYPHAFLEYVEAATIGSVLGLIAGLAEQQPHLRRWFQERSFGLTIVVRTLAYSVSTALVLSLVLSIEPALNGECRYANCVVDFVRGPLFARDLLFSTAFVFIAVFTAQVVLLVGTRNFGRLLAGRYRTPREIRAEFMFVDLRGSTAIAETLGHERYSRLLRDFFADIQPAIDQSNGEVYQYVGDEVVIVWPGRRASARWLECFGGMRAGIAAKRSHYLREYGLVPEFKAGVHAGAAVVGEVGTLQRAHVYHGDVLNTAARIQSKCNELGFDLLASNDALSVLPPDQQARFEPLAPVSLRGKAETVTIHALTEARVARRS